MFSVRVPEYAGTQEGTLHFHYLLNENGGLLHMAGSLDSTCSRCRGQWTDLTKTIVGCGASSKASSPASIVPRPHPGRCHRDLAAFRNWRRNVHPRPARNSVALYPIGTVMVMSWLRATHAKRERQLRPLTVSDFFLKRLVAIPAHFFRWGPAKKFARRYIVPRVLPQMMTGDIPTQEMTAIRRSCSGWPTARSTSSLVRG